MNQLTVKIQGREARVLVRDSVDQSVAAEIFNWREYRAAEEVISRAKDPIIDVGSHVGLFVIYCRLFNKSVPIYALEPEKNNAEMLRRNIDLNKLDNVFVREAALAKTSGRGRLWLFPDNHNHRLAELSEEKPPPNAPLQPVKILSLFDLCLEHKIKRISLLKMDIEGGERELLAAWGESEFSLLKAIILEYHNRRKDDHKKLERILRRAGFGVVVFPSRFDKKMGFIFAVNKRNK